MFSFLRKIRKSLLNSGMANLGGTSAAARKPASPAGRYIFYALGEILLVMVGILLALQVNNWNQNRIQNINENNLLLLLNENLQEQKKQAEFSLRLNYDRLSTAIKFLDYMDSSLVFHDSLIHDLRIITRESTTNYTVNSAYESIKEIKLSNDLLTEKIHELYEVQLPRIDSRTTYTPNITEFFERYTTEHFDLVDIPLDESIEVENTLEGKVQHYIENEWFRSQFGYRPKNYQYFRHDPEFRNLLKKSFEFRTGKIIHLNRVISVIDEIIRILLSQAEIRKSSILSMHLF